MNRKIIIIACLIFIILFFFNDAQQQDFPELKGPYLGQKLPGGVPELFMPGIISNCDLNSSVYFSPDGKYFFFNSSRVSELNAKNIPDGPGKAFWVGAGFVEELKPKELK